MKVKEIREMSNDDFLQKEKSLKKELFDLNNMKKLGNVEKPTRFKAIKKDIARMLTVIKEREKTQ